ncbi:hypothetical protein [Saccharopolyspora gloriosae]|uniref:hypothetical protein n=1 Tax=Saccharopolyspora gloriosae TaxID=455344 RepID=UPI001FB75B55|nr:hypothetical protein [Saccharopolyspora gloriosae]
MIEKSGLELLITVVVGADDDRSARDACRALLRQVGGRIVESGDCSDEEPGCWSVTVGVSVSEPGVQAGPAALARAVRMFLRELGPRYGGHRVACEPPTAWTVIDDPDLVEGLVSGGERLLVEAWAGSELPGGSDFRLDDPDEPVAEPEPVLSDVDEQGRPRPRLELLVDVVTERRAGAEWPARALASRLSRHSTITDWTERPPMVRIVLDLGPSLGEPAEIVANAVQTLGGNGWSRLRMQDRSAVSRWSAAPTPPSGIAAVELSAAAPVLDSVDRQPAR